LKISHTRQTTLSGKKAWKHKENNNLTAEKSYVIGIKFSQAEHLGSN